MKTSKDCARANSVRPQTLRRSTSWCYLAIIAFLGCGERQYTVDAPAAKEVLQSSLEAWKKGESPDRLKERRPPVVVQDPDWSEGAELAEFRLLDAGKEDGPNFRCGVELTVKTKDGNTSKIEVRYLVTTSPNVTVVRELF